MRIKTTRIGLLLTIVCVTAGASVAGNITMTLDSTNSSAFIIRDSNSNLLAGVWADGRVVGGGILNSASGTGATVSGGGGFDGTTTQTVGNAASGPFSTVAGGINNNIGAGGWYAAIGGGYFNVASTGSTTVAGGYYNGAYGLASTVGGGAYNTALGAYGTVPGGIDSHASAEYSFAAGRGAIATNSGAFVWADATPAYLYSTAANQFLARASGGVKFFTDAGATVGVELAAGGNGWLTVSDRNLKENFEDVDRNKLLDKLDAIPITTWNMKTQPDTIRHIGPMAQDFYAAFGMGETNTHIGYSDADGVALASIQGLYRMLRESNAERDRLQTEVDQLKQRLDRLENQIKKTGAQLP